MTSTATVDWRRFRVVFKEEDGLYYVVRDGEPLVAGRGIERASEAKAVCWAFNR